MAHKLICEGGGGGGGGWVPGRCVNVSSGWVGAVVVVGGQVLGG